MHSIRVAVLAFVAITGCARATPLTVPTSVATTGDTVDAALRQIVADYTGLYRRETLSRWETLFLPGFTAANTRADGSVNVRGRDEFFEAQRRFHARVEGLREDLENVRIERHGPLASVWADYVVTEGAQRNRGKLALLIIRDSSAYRIHSLIFAYDR